LFRAVDKHGQLIAFMLSDRRNAAYCFLPKALKTISDHPPSSITTDKLASYPKAILRLLLKDAEHRTPKYPNNIIEADHGALKRVIRPARGFQRMKTALRRNQRFRSHADDPSRSLHPAAARRDR
jgi:transposase-like protein